MTAGLLGLPQRSWPVFGGLANPSWVQLSGHGDAPVWRLDVWNASAEIAPPCSDGRAVTAQARGGDSMLVLSDSLAYYYGPEGGLPAR